MMSESRFTRAVRQMDASWPLGRAAMVFAQSGVPVFPCAPEGKQPITRRGFHDATGQVPGSGVAVYFGSWGGLSGGEGG